jgi:hypothetical protein
MTAPTLTRRAPERAEVEARPGEAFLARPLAFIATAAILLTIFSWTFWTNSGRVAPTKDPAYYTWRTEVLMSEDPAALLRIEGPNGMFAGGYRVAAPVIGGMLRHVPAVSSLSVTVFLMVGTPVLTALLLAGFAYRRRGDPLLFHAVAFASAGLFLTPPFIGYLDNVLCLMFLAAALHFVGPARASWPARVALGSFLVLSGLTHPTTLVIFCGVLGIMACARLLVRRFDLRSVLLADGPMLLTAFAACLATLAIWTIGVWGRSASLAESALPPPYGSDFFVDRMVLWIESMRPVFNGPLLAIGLIGLLLTTRRAAEEDLARVSILWLAPLVGLFGFVAGLTYPYYRFFNTTLAWVLLVGVGAWLVMRFFVDVSKKGGAARIAALGVVAVVIALATNFTVGLEKSGWTNLNAQWLSEQERTDLDALRASLAAEAEPDRPVVFVIDDEPSRPFQIYGFSKLSGNTSRYGLPAGQIDRGFLYLGSLENYLAGEPTTRGEETYDGLSRDFLADIDRGLTTGDTARSQGTAIDVSREPVIVVAEVFNPNGSNTALLEEEPSEINTQGQEVWVLKEGSVTQISGPGNVGRVPFTDEAGDPSVLHLLRVIGGLVLLLVTGVIALRWLLPDATLGEGLGLAPVLATGLLTIAGFVVLAVIRSPFSAGLAWISYVVALGVSIAIFVRSRTRASTSRGETSAVA